MTRPYGGHLEKVRCYLAEACRIGETDSLGYLINQQVRVYLPLRRLPTHRKRSPSRFDGGARHRFAYLIVCGFCVFHQQRSGLHNLSGLAIAALRDVHLAPGLLNRVITGGMEAFDC
jgi:hypothetical protein